MQRVSPENSHDRRQGMPSVQWPPGCASTPGQSATKAPLVAAPWDYESDKGTPDDQLHSGSARKNLQDRRQWMPFVQWAPSLQAYPVSATKTPSVAAPWQHIPGT
ncbi:hypothetical protein ABBQ32_013249 [Trebouxia sp. C0010 RCD-2024]